MAEGWGPVTQTIGGTPVQPRVISVVGPASYAAGGFQVDASAFFSRIIAAVFTRAYNTAGGGPAARYHYNVGELGTDTFANGKFVCYVNRPLFTHTHAYDKADTPTGTANSGAAGADPHSHALTYTSTASAGPSATNNPLTELGNTFDISAYTYEFLVWGVPL